MKNAFKKIEETVQFVSENATKHDGACIIIATPDSMEENSCTLSFSNGLGLNIVHMLATALSENHNLRILVKDALALVEGQIAMAKLAGAEERRKARLQSEGESVQSTTASESGEERGSEQK